MTRAAEVLHFYRSDPDRLVALMRGLATSRDGWVNLQAVIDEDEDEQAAPDAQPARAGVFNWFSARGPSVPVSTWVPGESTRHGHEQDSIGIQHGAGPKAILRLADAGMALPAGWRRLADHPKRGLVVQLPDDVDAAAVLDWLFRASDVLSADALPDTWVAIVHHR